MDFNAPFKRMTLGDEPKLDTFTVRLNAEERLQLNADKLIIRQPKDSSAIKELAEIGHNVLHDPLLGGILKTVLENIRKSARSGALPENTQRRAKVAQMSDFSDTNVPERSASTI
jgi:hypothetical protein